MEDIAIEGKFIVYRDGAEGLDSGLRFPEPDEKGGELLSGVWRKSGIV